MTTVSVSAPLGGGEEQGSFSLPAPGSSPCHEPGLAHLPAWTPHVLGHKLDSIRLKFDPGGAGEEAGELPSLGSFRACFPLTHRYADTGLARGPSGSGPQSIVAG